MPARQRGYAVRRGGLHVGDENQGEGFKGGFKSKTEALDFANAQAETALQLREGDPAALRRKEMPTLEELVTEYLGQHICEPNTKATLEALLKKATSTFGSVRLNRLAVTELRAWRSTLPQGSSWHIVKALRQVLSYAVAVGLIDTNPAKLIPNPEPKRTEVLPFATVAEVEMVSAEMLPHYRAIPLLGCLTGLRPSELFGLERRDIDREDRVLHVRRVLIDGNIRPYGKTSGSMRVVPLAEKALEALADHPARIGSPLLFTTRTGGPVDLHRWRARNWTPALRAAGLSHRGPYAMRHTFAS